MTALRKNHKSSALKSVVNHFGGNGSSRMLLRSELVVRGYHGTTINAARDIRSQREFQKSDKKWDWLGYGTYFFQDAPHRAWEWASKYSVPRYGGNPAVVVVQINLEDCLDLLDVEACDFLAEFDKLFRRREGRGKIQEALQVVRGKIVSEKTNPGINVRDCVFINSACRYLKKKFDLDVKSVRAAFLEGRELTKGSWLFSRNHVQIAVRDAHCIDMDSLEILEEKI